MRGNLRLLDLFSGIGGFSYAAEHLVGGYETVAFVEREPFCQRVLASHWPAVPIYSDIRTFQPTSGSADVVCGGFPCQDISTAGKQAGIKQGTRSGLFYELIRVVRLVRPQFVVLENVAAILANGLDTVLGELAQAGFDAEWACIPASAVGACHQRDRWWLVAYPQGQQCHDCGSTDSAGPPGTAAQPRNCDGEDAAHPDSKGLQGETVAWIQGKGLWNSPSKCLDPNWRRYSSEPVLYRGDEGLSGRVDRLKALGNAVVPQVAAIPLARVRALADERT